MTIIQPATHMTIVATATLHDALSHTDPDDASGANTSPIRRRPQLVPREIATPYAQSIQSQEALDRALAAHPVPAAVAMWMTELKPSQFLAVALVRTFIATHGSGEGQGLFSGESRYARLESRIRQAARRVTSLPSFWSDLCNHLQVDTARPPQGLLELLSLSERVAAPMLDALADEAPTTIMLAREWHDQLKLRSASYTARTGQAIDETAMVTMSYRVEDLPLAHDTIVRHVPHYSGNALRHVLVREPGLVHLLAALDIDAEQLPPHVGRLLGSGGAIRKGSRAPDNEHAIGEALTRRYPLIELLGGAASGFMLPESALRVSSYLLCAENRAVLESYGVVADLHPAESLVSSETLAAHPGRWGFDPMLHSFETLIPGAQIMCLFQLTPWASSMAAGALAAALSTAQQGTRLGGRAARGYGHVSLDFTSNDKRSDLMSITALNTLQERYEEYLMSNAAALREGLLDGTFGTGHAVVEA